MAEEKVAAVLRAELTQFERWVLLQIVDQAWKDHLHSMDQVRESIGFRSFSQRDPRIEFKREAGRLFEEMKQSIREKVTDLVFKAKLTPQVGPPRAPGAPAPISNGNRSTVACAGSTPWRCAECWSTCWTTRCATATGNRSS